MRYLVTFDRIGRNRFVAPLTAEAGDADSLATQVYRYARPHLASRDVEVHVDLAEGKGYIFYGFNNSTFTIQPAPVDEGCPPYATVPRSDQAGIGWRCTACNAAWSGDRAHPQPASEGGA